jgi:hypothetical protein
VGGAKEYQELTKVHGEIREATLNFKFFVKL